MSDKALAGIRVLDLSRILAGPTAAQLLGDFGASVIKVERPGTGDDARRLGGPPLKDPQGRASDLSPMFVCANRNKQSVTIDLSHAQGQELVRKLAAWADILIENYKTGDLDRYGLGYAQLKILNPRLIYCSVTGFGQTGPYASRPGYDGIFQSMSGLMSVTGHADDRPGGGAMRVGVPITDIVGGLYAYGAIVTALHYRDHVSGAGQHLDIAMLDCAIAATCTAAANYLSNGIVQQRWGNEAANSVPSQTFRCADGEVQISAPSNEIFGRMCAVLGNPDIAEDERFASNQLRIRNRLALAPLLQPLFATRTRRELVAMMEASNVPCAPIYAVNEVFDDPHVRQRGASAELDHPRLGRMVIATNPVRMTATPVTEYNSPPMLGEHTEAVLKGVLGLSSEEFQDLRRNKVI